MALKKREKILAAVTGVFLVALLGVMLFSGGGSTLKQLRAERKNLAKDVREKEIKARPGPKAVARLTGFQHRALPENRQAHALYKKWLLELVVDRVGLDDADVTPRAPLPYRVRIADRPIYTALPFRVHGRGTLDQVVRFLFEFYSVGYLHKVHRMSITPIEDSRELRLEISVQALSMPGAKSANNPSKNNSGRLKLPKVDDYIQTIVWRKMEGERVVKSGGLFAPFVPYVPPTPPPQVVYEKPQAPPPPDPPRFDHARYTYVNSIVEVNGRPEVWLQVRTTGETLRRHEGEDFQIGSVRGTVVRIWVVEREVEIELDGEYCLVAFGENLRQGIELPD